jgi:hypothetical protein
MSVALGDALLNAQFCCMRWVDGGTVLRISRGPY